MKIRFWSLAMGCGLAASLSVMATLADDDPPSTAETDEDKAATEKTRRLNELIEKSIDWYELFPDAYATTPLRAKPILRWRNVAREQAGEAMMVVWTQNGRPEAVASIFPWDGYLCHEFGSLSRDSKLVARDGSLTVWNPSHPGLDFKDIPDTPPPGETPVARLREMRKLAERFHATMTGWKADSSDREELRLLPRALYRYEIPDAKDATARVADGALFGFVMGTDPEVVLAIEAVRDNGKLRWQYAFSRATSGGLEARLGTQIVWTAEKFPPNRDPRAPQVTLQRILEE